METWSGGKEKCCLLTCCLLLVVSYIKEERGVIIHIHTHTHIYVYSFVYGDIICEERHMKCSRRSGRIDKKVLRRAQRPERAERIGVAPGTHGEPRVEYARNAYDAHDVLWNRVPLLGGGGWAAS